MRLLKISSILALLAGPVHAQGFILFGAAGQGCGSVLAAITAEQAEWTRQRRAQPSDTVATIEYAVLYATVTGFMTGANWQATIDLFGQLETLSRILFIEQYCRSSPLNTLIMAMIALRNVE